MEPREPIDLMDPTEDTADLRDALILAEAESSGGDGKEDPGSTEGYWADIKAHNRKKWSRVLIVISVIILALLIYVLIQNYRHYSGVSLSTNSRFLTEDGAEIIGLGLETYDMQQPRAVVEGDILAIADIEGYTVCVFDKEGLRGRISTERPIHAISVSKCGEVAVTMNETSATWIRLFSSTGREIAYLVRYMSIHGYPMSMAISPNGERLTISSLEVVDGVIKTDMAFHSFGAEGAEKENNLLADAEFSGEVFPFTHFMSDDIFVAVSDSRLAYYTIGRELKNTVSNMISENIRGVYYNDRYMALLFTDTSGDHQYRLDLYDKNGDKKSSVGFSMDFTTLQISGGYIYLNNDQELQVYTVRGREIFNGTIGTTVRAVIPSSIPRRMTVVTDSEIDTLRLH